jgi:hypothetical protein
MAGKGGARPGSGRPTKADEDKVRNLAVGAIVAKYGSEEAGFSALIESGEPALIKWVYEHGYGKPKEFVDITTNQPLLPTFIFNFDGSTEDNG